MSKSPAIHVAVTANKRLAARDAAVQLPTLTRRKLTVKDANTDYTPPPSWVTAAIDLGFRSRMESSDLPFFGLISTPCESCFAGLIALGAELHALSTRQSTFRSVDKSCYFNFLRTLNPGTVLRCKAHPRKTYALVREEQRNGSEPAYLRARRLNIGHEQVLLINESTCLNWWPEDDAPESAGGYDGMFVPPEAATLRFLLPDAAIPDDRLRVNCEEIVFIGPPGGTTGFRSVYEEHCSIGIDNGDFVPLSTLLGLRGWTSANDPHATRGVFINALSPDAVANAKMAARKAVLAIFDGAAPYLKLGDYFCQCSRIVVACRSLSNSLLERLCSKLYQDQHDSGAIAENGNSWLSNLPPAIQGFRTREPRREGTS